MLSGSRYFRTLQNLQRQVAHKRAAPKADAKPNKAAKVDQAGERKKRSRRGLVVACVGDSLIVSAFIMLV